MGVLRSVNEKNISGRLWKSGVYQSLLFAKAFPE
jgi:hypothetical protein